MKKKFSKGKFICLILVLAVIISVWCSGMSLSEFFSFDWLNDINVGTVSEQEIDSEDLEDSTDNTPIKEDITNDVTDLEK